VYALHSIFNWYDFKKHYNPFALQNEIFRRIPQIHKNQYESSQVQVSLLSKDPATLKMLQEMERDPTTAAKAAEVKKQLEEFRNNPRNSADILARLEIEHKNKMVEKQKQLHETWAQHPEKNATSARINFGRSKNKKTTKKEIQIQKIQTLCTSNKY